MKNVDYEVKANVLTIKVDLQKEFGPSGSGKTIVVASSGGFIPVGGSAEQEIAFSLNVNRRAKK